MRTTATNDARTKVQATLREAIDLLDRAAQAEGCEEKLAAALKATARTLELLED